MNNKIVAKNSLKWRIILSYPVFGMVLGMTMLLFLYASLEWQERDLMDRYIKEELTHFVASTHNDPSLLKHTTIRWNAYVSERGHAPESWPQTRNLTPGIHEIIRDGEDFDLGIAEHDGRRYTLVINDTNQEEREDSLLRILFVVFILSLLLAGWLGLLIAGRVVNPIMKLTKFVEEQDRSQPCVIHSPPEELRNAEDETGLLARRFEDYQRQLCDFITREQTFTGDASHELRTPLSVISAATETLLLRCDEDRDGNVDFGHGLLRIQRAVKEMETTVDLLLSLARETLRTDRADEGVEVDLETLLNALVDRQIELRSLPDQAIKRAFNASPRLKVSEASIRLVLANLLENALDHGQKPPTTTRLDPGETIAIRVCITLEDDCVCIEDHGTGVNDLDLATISERGRRLNQNASDRVSHSGLGLAIVERLCAFHGWTLEFAHSEQGGLVVRWFF